MEIKQLIVGRLETNCYLLISEKELAIIDPGGEPNKILEEIEKIKAEPKYIINTHYHLDHTSGNSEIKSKTEAKILIHEADKDFSNFEIDPRHQKFGVGVDQFLEEGNEIKIGKVTLKVIHTPGHTKGSICLLGDNFMFSGDTLFEIGFGRTDLLGGSSKDLQGSLQKLSKFLKPGMKIYPGHGEIFEY